MEWMAAGIGQQSVPAAILMSNPLDSSAAVHRARSNCERVLPPGWHRRDLEVLRYTTCKDYFGAVVGVLSASASFG